MTHALRWIVVMALCCVATARLDAQGSLAAMRQINPDMPAPMRLDETRIAANQIDKTSGTYLTLYSDVRDGVDVQELVRVFDLAVPQWCQLFAVDISKTEGWHLSAFLMADRDRFRAAGVLPETLPSFPAGYNLGHHFWILPQPGKYYTRHLLLHEGTHAFMQWFLAGSGPPWYSEGMAEKIALHRWHEGQLQLDFRPTSTEQVDYWGRPRVIREANKSNSTLMLDEVFDFPDNAFRNVDSYAWAWAACDFLTHHPKTQSAFAKLTASAKDRSPRFSLLFKRQVQRVWAQVEIDWQQYIAELDYGTPPEAMVITKVSPQPVDGSWKLELNTHQAWQDTGIKVAAGERWSINADGMFVIRQTQSSQTKPNESIAWKSTAQGITIEYYRRRPLGQLLVGVVGDTPKKTGVIPILTRDDAGQVQIDRAGRIVLRINESPAELFDNQGSLEIQIKRIDSK